MNIHFNSDRLDMHIAASMYIAATKIPGVHITPIEEADLVINIDSIHSVGLKRGKKTAYFESDDYLHKGKNTQYYDVDLLYIISRANLPLYPPGTRWLPVAMEPTIHYHWPFPETRDFVFIGQYNNEAYNFRKTVVEELSKNFDGIVGACQPQDYPKFLSQARIRLNINPRLNNEPPLIVTRFYESMGMGFTMNDYDSTMDEIATEGTHYVGFSSVEEAKEKMRYFLSNESERLQIGNAGKILVLTKHTWEHRLRKILEDYEKL
jgi:hypothetical protein